MRRFRERSRSPGRQARASEVISASALLEATRRARQAEEENVQKRDINMPICQHFLQNACRFGDRCTKIHPGGSEARMRSANTTPICAHFLQGRCAYGAGCNKTHLGAAEARQRCLQFSGALPPLPGMPAGTTNELGQQQLPPSAPAAGIRGYYEFVGKRVQGVIKSFSAANGYGFISCQQATEVFGRDVYALSDQIGNLCQGHTVSFELFLNATGHPQAKNVVPETIFHGYVKSFSPQTGYGFIACVETMETFHRDVFVSQDLITEIPVGAEVAFTIILTDRKQPQANAVRRESNGSAQAATQAGTDAQIHATVAEKEATESMADCSESASEASTLKTGPPIVPQNVVMASNSPPIALYDPFSTGMRSAAVHPGNVNGIVPQATTLKTDAGVLPEERGEPQRPRRRFTEAS